MAERQRIVWQEVVGKSLGVCLSKKCLHKITILESYFLMDGFSTASVSWFRYICSGVQEALKTVVRFCVQNETTVAKFATPLSSDFGRVSNVELSRIRVFLGHFPGYNPLLS